jgi:hypothetical protein
VGDHVDIASAAVSRVVFRASGAPWVAVTGDRNQADAAAEVDPDAQSGAVSRQLPDLSGDRFLVMRRCLPGPNPERRNDDRRPEHATAHY